MTLITELQRQLKAAEAGDAKQKRENAAREIQRLTGEGAKLRIELEPLAKQIKTAQNKRLRFNGELVHAREQIAAYSTPLDLSDFPSDAEIRAHAEQLRLWQERQQELLAASKANEESIGFPVMRHAIGLQKRLNEIKFEIENLTAVAEGRRPGQIEGGINCVTEDFLGASQCGPPRHL